MIKSYREILKMLKKINTVIAKPAKPRIARNTATTPCLELTAKPAQTNIIKPRHVTVKAARIEPNINFPLVFLMLVSHPPL